MKDKSTTPTMQAGDITRLLQDFANNAANTAEASADGLVSVRMSPTFALLSIDFTTNQLAPELKQRLEAAALSAINSVVHKVSLQSGQVLVEFQRRQGTDK